MLRPQVFAIQKGTKSIGLSASEKQAIDAVLESLSQEDSLFWPQADFYWNARGGSYTDGGAFIFTVFPEDGKQSLLLNVPINSGHSIHAETLNPAYEKPRQNVVARLPDLDAHELFLWAKKHVFQEDYARVNRFIITLVDQAKDDASRAKAFTVLTNLIDYLNPLGTLRRSRVLALLNKGIGHLAYSIQLKPSPLFTYLAFGDEVGPGNSENQTLIIDAKGFPPQGQDSLALAIVKAYRKGLKKFIVFNCIGQRFIGNGLGSLSNGVRIDVFGSSGDYLASGIDGAEIYVHGNAQDQIAQIMKAGKLVVYGDVGQTFLYGAKGGSSYIRGNAAGRPAINAVGQPRVVINGTCLDYLAESFMAGVPLKGGGFVILNAIAFDDEGNVVELKTPYPGNNLFSLASGGALYIRDPALKIVKDQLNGGEFGEMTSADWDLIVPYLGERIFIWHYSRTLVTI